MALSILILCIVTMLSFDPVASRSSPHLLYDSTPLLDFGFSRLIDKLIAATNHSFYQKALFAIFTKVEKQMKPVLQSGGLIGKINTTDETLHQYIKSAKDISFLYESFETLLEQAVFLEHPKKFLDKLLKQCNSSNTDSLGAILHNFRHEDKLNGKNFMDLLIEEMNVKVRTDACWYNTQSPRYKISTLYRELAIITAQAYALSIYTYNLLVENVDEHDEYKVDERKNYDETLRIFRKSAISAISSASREIRSCYDAVDEGGKTHIELKWLFNPIAINEVYLNAEGSCWKTCDHYQSTKFYQYDGKQPSVNQCSGGIYNCFLETEDPCHPPGTSKVWGFHSSHQGSIARDEEKWEWCGYKYRYPIINGGLFTRCDTCICYCDDHDRSDIIRKFSLRAVESDAAKNRVITGIQFVEKNQVIYLRIQEGTLGPKGIIEKSTVKWQPVNEIDYKSPVTSAKELFTVTYDKKSVNLDTLIVPNDEVLTGIGLYAEGSHLALKIKSHTFNYSTGILQEGIWLSYASTTRHEITMNAPDFPYYINQSIVNTKRNPYVTFRKTDYKKDASQTTIPFIDARPVVSHLPVAFTGAGIYYSETAGFGGFIGLKAIVYDYPEDISN